MKVLCKKDYNDTSLFRKLFISLLLLRTKGPYFVLKIRYNLGISKNSSFVSYQLSAVCKDWENSELGKFERVLSKVLQKQDRRCVISLQAALTNPRELSYCE